MASESLASRTLKSLLRDDDGYVAVVAALAMTVLILTASLALDFGRFSYLRRDLGVAPRLGGDRRRETRARRRALPSKSPPAAEPDMRRTALAHLRTNYPSLDIADGDLTLSNPPHPSNPSARDGERLEVWRHAQGKASCFATPPPISRRARKSQPSDSTSSKSPSPST